MRNSEFSGDEIIFSFLSLVIAFGGAVMWYSPVIRMAMLGRSRGRIIVALMPLLAISPLIPVLALWADPVYVVRDPAYQGLFAVGGLAWIWLAGALLPIVGLSVRDDALERRNRAAAIATGGMIVGAGIIYACANIGGGPTIWTTLLPAFVATFGWLLLQLMVESMTHPSEAIAIDRDPASAIRHAATAIATALILGRAVAGDWRSWERTWRELLWQGWPAVMVTIVAVVLQVVFRPTPRCPFPSKRWKGIWPAALFLAAAVIDWLWLGWPEIGRHFISYERYTGGK